MKLAKTKESFFWNLCYLTVFLDLLLVVFNPIRREYLFFYDFFIISYFIAISICLFFSKLISLKFTKSKKNLFYFKLLGIVFILLTLVFLVLLLLNSGLINQESISSNKVFILVVLFVCISSFSSIIPIYKAINGKIKDVSKGNGVLFNLTCFSARWLSFCSALLVNTSEYGLYIFAISVFLSFYFLNQIKVVYTKSN